MCKQKIKQVLTAGILGIAVVLSSSIYAGDNNIKELVSENFVATTTFDNSSFDDIKGSEWFMKGVSTSVELGLMQGESDTKFNPNGNITVAQTIAVASRVNALYETGSLDVLEDYSGSKWYDGVVKYATEKGIIKANDFSTGDMNRPATRAELAYILYGSIPSNEMQEINQLGMDDIKDVNSKTKHADSLLKAINSGIITGYEDGTVKPNNKITRAEASAIIDRVVRPTERVRQEKKQDKPQESGGRVVYVAPHNEIQPVYDKPGAGLTPIKVKYGKHTYLSNNQQEYDYVVKVAEDMLQFKGKAGETYKKELDRWNDSSYKPRIIKQFKSEFPNISEAKAYELYKLESAMYSIKEHKGSRTENGINSAYQMLTLGKGDCTASAMVNMLVADMMGYNAKTVADDSAVHEWVMVQVDGQWIHNLGSGFTKTQTYNRVTSPDTFNHAE